MADLSTSEHSDQMELDNRKMLEYNIMRMPSLRNPCFGFWSYSSTVTTERSTR